MPNPYHAFMAIACANFSRSRLWAGKIGTWRWRIASFLLKRACKHAVACVPQYNPDDIYEMLEDKRVDRS